jgi:CDP-diacylglycerol--glycerol-3-phosphate 3-phosphatidyltransferase
MTVHVLKPQFQARLRPLVGRLADAGVSPNGVTLTGCGLSLASGALLWLGAEWHGLFALLPLCLLARVALDAMGGMLAREFGQPSALGALLHELCDVISDAALYLPFARLPHFAPPAVVLVVLLALLAELAGVLGPTVGAERRHDGPLGKSDRALVFGVLGLAVGLGLPPQAWLAVVRGALREDRRRGVGQP